MKRIGLFALGVLFSQLTLADDNITAVPKAQPMAGSTATADKVAPLDIAKLQSGQTTLRVGYYSQLPPFYFTDQGAETGFGYEVLSQVVKKAGVQKVAFVGYDNNIDLNLQLQQGKIDVIANSWDLPGMRKQFLLTTPYYTKGGLSFLYYNQRGSYANVDDLKNATIGVFKEGYADRYWLPAHGIAKDAIKSYSNIKELMFALKDDDVDVAVVYYPLALLAQQQAADELTSVLIQPINDVYAVRTQDAPLQGLLNQAIQSLTQDGTIAKIQAQYFNGNSKESVIASPQGEAIQKT